MGAYLPYVTGRKSGSRIKRVLKRLFFIVLVAACIALLAYFLINFTFTTINTSLNQNKKLSALSEQTALSELEAGQLAAPDLSAFAYIDASNLIGPRFSDVIVGDPLTNEEGTYRDIGATANYNNSSINVTVSLRQRYNYDDQSASWIAGDITLKQAKVTPLKAVSASSIQLALPGLLADYDEDIAEEFEESSCTITTDADKTGGTATATLSRKESSRLLSRQIDLGIAWSETAGWQITVLSVGALSEGELAGNSSSSTTQITCSEGDLIQLDGAITDTSDGYLLQTDDITIDIGGLSVTVDEFKLVIGSDLNVSDYLNYGATVYGYINYTDTTSDTLEGDESSQSNTGNPTFTVTVTKIE